MLTFILWTSLFPGSFLGGDVEGIGKLHEQLKSKDAEARFKAAQALAWAGPKARIALPTLKTLLKDAAVRVRVAAAEGLWRLDKDESGFPSLSAALEDKDPAVRRQSVAALQGIGPPAKAALPKLLAVLNDEDATLRVWVLEALETVAPKEETAVAAAKKALADPDGEVRVVAARVVWRAGKDAEAGRTLIAALKDKKDRVRSRAAATIRFIGPELEAALDPLIEALADKSNDVRLHALEALAHFGPKAKAAVPVLIPLLKDEAFAILFRAQTALAKIGPAAVPAMIKILEDDDGLHAMQAVSILGEMGPGAKEAVPALVRIFKDLGKKPDFTGTRSALAFTLGRIGPDAKEAVPLLADMLKDKEGRDRISAAQALWSITKHDAAIPALIEALKGPGDRTRAEAAQTLERIGPPAKAAVPVLLETIKDKLAEVRLAGALALWSIDKNEKAIGVLIPILATEPMPTDLHSGGGPAGAAMVALARIGKPAVPALKEALKSPNPLIRARAENVLEAIAEGRTGPDSDPGK